MESTPLKNLACMGFPYNSEDPAIGIILVSDQQFQNIANFPDEAVEKVFPQDTEKISLREHCRRGAERGATKLLVAYDYFFGGSERSLYPDTPAFQDTLKKINDVAAEYGIGLEPSIVSPLELGVGYKAKTGESGRWMHYREGLRDPQTGEYTVMMWQHTRWCNNKGPTPLTLIGARAFAFKEERIPRTPFFAVDPDGIVELEPPSIEPMPGTSVETGDLAGAAASADAMFLATRVRVHGKGGPEKLDRVHIVLLYETVEMDYFSPSALQFMEDLVEGYHKKGIRLMGIYADETHIQQDWSYHNHFDNGQLTLRYVSEGMERMFADQFGARYADFARYMLYFTCHQHDFLSTHEPKLPSQHVFGSTEKDIQDTLRFRKNYYDFLESRVVKLATDTLKKLEQVNERKFDLFYHSTWAESPTCDAWAAGGVHRSWSAEEHQRQYEYTPDFIWSNTVHQASAACANQFKWNEFLTGGNDDTPEGGYADRNYYGRALACSLAALNRKPLASAGMWGMPPAVSDRMFAVSQVFGALGHPSFRSVQEYAPRRVEVLFLYPQDLVAVDERFGSWMVQYGYANLITAEKLVEYGQVGTHGLLEVKGSRYNTLCVLYEPFPEPKLLALLDKWVKQGGKIIWSGTPPLQAGSTEWIEGMFGAQLEKTDDPLGWALPARTVTFEGRLKPVPSQAILTDFVVDRVFPVKPLPGVEVVARIATGTPKGNVITGTIKSYSGGGQAVYLGFRPRDDQAASTGVEVRTWFEILNTLGAYPGSGAFDFNDNPAVISRTTNLLVCDFPNGTTAACQHYRTHAENWQGGFFRREDEDRQFLEENPVPDNSLVLDDLHVAGQRVSYKGRGAAAWRVDKNGKLIAFAGNECTGIQVNGKTWKWSETPVDVSWHPLSADMQTEGYLPLWRVWVGSECQVRVPLDLDSSLEVEVWQGALFPGRVRTRRASYGKAGLGDKPVAFAVENGALVLTVDEEMTGHWLYVVNPKK